jgi:quinoprotein glucose dehydrogenase
VRREDFGEAGQLDLHEGLGEHVRSEYSITSPPAILGDLVITGALVLDNRRKDGPGGVVRAFDVRSGELRWSWDPLPPGADPELADAGQRYQKGTTNVWSIISVDSARNLVFVPTGNSTPDYYGGLRGSPGKRLDYYSSSVVALDGANGHQRLPVVPHNPLVQVRPLGESGLILPPGHGARVNRPEHSE